MQEMKYFNEGNDCDICKNKLMTGRDGTVEDCRRRQNGLSCRFEERDIRTCPVCEHEVDREEMHFTKDCHRTAGSKAEKQSLRSVHESCCYLYDSCSIYLHSCGDYSVCESGC